MVERKDMPKNISNSIYSELVLNSVKGLEDKYSHYDTQWNKLLTKVASTLIIDSEDPAKIPHLLEDATIEAARKKGRPDFITIAGPGAVGKGTLRAIMGIEKNTINDTTREPRGSGETREKHGEQYFFINEREMFFRVAGRNPEEKETLEKLARSGKKGEYVYSPVYKPGRGWYALRQEQVTANLANGEQFIIEDNIQVSLDVLRFIRNDLKRNDINPLHIYILPPGPVMPTLLMRLYSRAEQTNDQKYLVGGKIVIPEEDIENTLGQRQIDEFKPVIDLIGEGGNVLFLVNDDLGRMKQIVPNIKDW